MRTRHGLAWVSGLHSLSRLYLAMVAVTATMALLSIGVVGLTTVLSDDPCIGDWDIQCGSSGADALSTIQLLAGFTFTVLGIVPLLLLIPCGVGVAIFEFWHRRRSSPAGTPADLHLIEQDRAAQP